MAAINQIDLSRFLAAKGTYRCSYCGNGTYFLNGGREMPGMQNVPVESHIPSVDPRPGAHQGAHHFYSITCTNCGCTDFFHQNQIVSWLSQNPGT